MKDKYLLAEYVNNTGFPFSINIPVHDGDIPVHMHDFTELVIVLNGTSSHRINGEEYLLNSGDVFVVGEDGTHGYMNACRLELCNIMFDFNWFLDDEPELKKLPGFQSLFILEPCFRREHRFESRLRLDPIQLNLVMQLLQLMKIEYSENRDGYRMMIRVYFLMFIAYLSRQFSAGSSRVSRKLFLLADSVAYLERNFQNDVSVPKLAEIAFLSVRQYTRVFKNAYKTTPNRYIIKLRLQHACAMMRRSGLTLSQIAMESGFTDSSFFSRQFKKEYGVSPREYRRMIV